MFSVSRQEGTILPQSQLALALDMMYSDSLIREETLAPIELITEQRQAVNHYLRTSGNRVYGFNTLLGQADKTDAIANDQRTVLDAHLIGRSTTEIPRLMCTAFSVAKLLQLGHGGSGISPKGYRMILDRPAQAFSSYSGAWWDSFGAGDVIPASWWIHRLLEGSESDAPIDSATLAAGDLIALMNGHFISTGAALYTFHSIQNFFARSLLVLAQECDTPLPSQLAPYDDRVLKLSDLLWMKNREIQSIQRTVVHRDLLPFIVAVTGAMRDLEDALEMRLSRASNNPYFEFNKDGSVEGHYSQSSFLDLRLSSALSTVGDAVNFLVAGIQALMKDHDEEFSIGKIEIPKLLEVVMEEVVNYPMSTRFGIEEAGGAETICDKSLMRTKSLISRLSGGADAITLYESQNGKIDMSKYDKIIDVLTP